MTIYPSITTTQNNWQKAIKDCQKLGIKSVCLFPTCLDYSARKKLYPLLEKSNIDTIPLVHVRHDFRFEEIEYFMRTFKTKLFNIHPQGDTRFPLEYNFSRFKDNIYLETTLSSLASEVENYAGICLDVSHVENQRLRKTKLYSQFINELHKYPIGVAHISAIGPFAIKVMDIPIKVFDKHHYESLSEFDYLLRYKEFLPEVCALELENPIPEQLIAKAYIEKLLQKE